MELIKPGTKFDFVGKMKLFLIISIVAVAASILLLIVRGGPNLGIDFRRGHLFSDQVQPADDD